MKILIVMGNGRSDDTLGDHAVPINLANKLVDMGVDVTVLANSKDNHSVDPRIEVIEFTSHGKGWAKDLVGKSRELYYEGNFDNVNYHFSAFSVAKWISRLEDDIRISYVNHSSVMGGISTVRIVDDLRKLNTKPNTRLVFISDYMKVKWKKLTGLLPTDDVPNGIRINNGVIYPDRSVLVPSDKRNGKLIHVGRIDQVKNTIDILDFIREYHIPSIIIGKPQVRVTGKKGYPEECLDIIRSSDEIEYYPSLTNDEVRKKLSESVASINMSRSECKCLSLLESLSVGTPILSSACTDNLDTITIDQTCPSGRYGIYEDTYRKSRGRKLSMMYEGWKDLLNNPRDAYTIYDETKKYYDVEVMARNYLDMYESMM